MPGSDRTAPPSHNNTGSVAQHPQRDRPRPDALEQAERLVQTGSWEWDIETDALLWSDNVFRLLGLEPGAVQPTPDYLVERTHPQDRERLVGELAAARQQGVQPDIVFRVVWPD